MPLRVYASAPGKSKILQMQRALHFCFFFCFLMLLQAVNIYSFCLFFVLLFIYSGLFFLWTGNNRGMNWCAFLSVQVRHSRDKLTSLSTERSSACKHTMAPKHITNWPERDGGRERRREESETEDDRENLECRFPSFWILSVYIDLNCITWAELQERERERDTVIKPAISPRDLYPRTVILHQCYLSWLVNDFYYHLLSVKFSIYCLTWYILIRYIK